MKKIAVLILAGITALSITSCADTFDTVTNVNVTAIGDTDGTNTTAGSENTENSGTNEAEVTADAAGIANPWVETDAAGINEKCGNTFGVPKDASGVIYRWNDAGEIAEMQFSCGGVDWTARMQKVPVYEDISGMNYQWEGETQTDVLPITGYLRVYHGDNEVATSVLWQDDFVYKEEYMLSLSCVSEKEADISIAKEIFTVHQ